MELVCAGRRFICALFYVFHVLPNFLAFNLDTQIPIVKDGIHSDSYFGFSVAQHFIYNQEKRITEPWVLVGAPRDNITDYTVSESVRNLVRPGAVYRCPVSTQRDDCSLIKIDEDDGAGSFVDKSDQWLGVSVSSQGTEDGKAVACAHKYKKAGTSYRWGLGICISMSNSLTKDEYWQPCDGKPTDKGHGQYGFCQAGTSSAIGRDGDLVIGAPGPYNWRGAIFKNNLQSSLAEDPRWLSSAVEDVIPGFPGPEPATGYYSYLGLSVKIGNVINGRKTYVAGAPRSRDSGQVLLFQPTKDFLEVKLWHYLTGEQFGSCFGYDIAIADFNSDGKEDLAVGAPFYHDTGVGGAIYIYLNGLQSITSSTRPLRITSRKMKDMECAELNCLNARFGFALSRIGDINRDGFEDLAVGAPYEGSGAVYIFHGSSSGIIKEYAQRIYASELPSAGPLATFGYSLSGGEDFDFNSYPDLVVGAYTSDKIVILRSRPIINVNASFVSTPRQIDPKLKECGKDRRKNNCFELTICFKYTAEPKERFTGPVELEYKIDAEKFAGARVVRVFFKGTSVENAFIERRSSLREQNVEQCMSHIVYIRNETQDFLNPIKFLLTYKLKDVTPPQMRSGRPLPDINSYPILSDADAKIPLSVNFIKDCAHATECLSNLNVSATLDLLEKDVSGDYILQIGQKDELKLDVMIGNTEEEAHEAMLYVTLPESFTYKGLDERGKQYPCTPATRTVVACFIGNPLPHEHNAKFGIRLSVSKVLPTTHVFNISLLVNTTSKETNLLNDVALIKGKAIIKADIEVRGTSLPSEVYFTGKVLGESGITSEDQIGPEIIHRFEVKHSGGGVVASSTLSVSWPYEMGQPHDSPGKHLLYLMDPPEVDGPAVCLLDKTLINPRNFRRKESTLPKSDRRSEQAEKGRTMRKRLAKRSREDEEMNVRLDCVDGRAKCHIFPCNIGELREKESVVIQLRFRLWQGTFLEDFTAVSRVLLSSKAGIIIDPRLNVQDTNNKNDFNTATTIVQPSQEVQVSPGVDLWIIIVSVCVGLVLLVLLILLLWKCGFFKRKRPDELAEHKAKLESQKNNPDE